VAACRVNLPEVEGSIPSPATKKNIFAGVNIFLYLSDMNELTLTIKKVFLDEILSGSKKVEYRDYTDFYIDRLCVLDKKGEFKAWKPITHIIFVAGRTKKAQRIRVAVKRVAFEEWLDEKTGAPTDEFTFAIYLGKVEVIESVEEKV